jgi:hypothetical protein
VQTWTPQQVVVGANRLIYFLFAKARARAAAARSLRTSASYAFTYVR